MLFKKLIEKRIASYQTEMTQRYYDEVSNMYDKMRGWRHDYRHHIQVMKVHMSHGEYDEVSAYLDELDNDLTNVETVVKTGNAMADAVSICRDTVIQKLSALGDFNMKGGN